MHLTDSVFKGAGFVGALAQQVFNGGLGGYGVISQGVAAGGVFVHLQQEADFFVFGHERAHAQGGLLMLAAGDAGEDAAGAGQHVNGRVVANHTYHHRYL